MLETVLTGRNLLSPVLATASRDVAAYSSTVTAQQGKAAASAQTAASAQARAATTAAASTTAGATTQSVAAQKIAASNVTASTSAQASAQAQMRAHTQAAQSATVTARTQQAANDALIRSNGLASGSLTPLTAGLGLAAAAVGYAAFRGMEFDAAMSQVQAASQASAGDMDRLREAAITLGADTQYSAEEAAGGITELAKAGVSTADVLNGGLAGALNLAAAGQMEVADAAEIGATALSVFRLEGNQMSHVADLLAAGAGKAQGSVYDLGAALNQSALVADQTGLSIEDTAGALAMFASNGLTGSDAGTSFKTMLQALTPNSEAAAKAMEAIGFSAYDAQGNFVGLEGVAQQLKSGLSQLTVEQQNATLKTIFGSDAVRAAAILYKEGATGVREWRDNVNDAGFAQEQAAALTDNLKGDLERLGGAFDSTMTSIGDGTQGTLRFLVQALTDVVDAGGSVINFWNNLPGPVQGAVGALGAFVLLRGPVSSMMATLQTKAASGAESLSGIVLNADRAKAALGRLGKAAAGMVAVYAVSEIAGQLSDMASTGDNARETIDQLHDSLEGLTGAERIEANAQAVRTLRDEAADYQRVIDNFDNQNWFNKNIWTNPFSTSELTSVIDAEEALEELNAEIARLGAEGPPQMETLVSSVQGAGSQIAAGFAVAADGTVQSSEEAQEALDQWRESLQGIAAGFVEPLGAYSELLDAKQTKEREAAEATAAATKDSSDSWEDYVDEVDVSLGELADRLQKQIEDQENWRTNIGQIAAWAGADVAQHLAAMGEEGVDLVAKMADGSSAEAQRMAGLIREDIRLGGAGWTAQMDTEMKNVQAIAAAGGQKTAAGLAFELGLGVQQVADIAARYGIVLANGLNPLMEALGQRRIAIMENATRDRGAGVRGFGLADGGEVPGYSPHDRADNIPAMLTAGEIVWSRADVAAHGGPDRVEQLRTSRRGYADGGFVTAADVPRPFSTAPKGPPISTAADATMQKGFDEVRAWLTANTEAISGGTAGGGAIGGAWSSLWTLVKGQIPQARINSTLRPGDPGYHGRGKAIDFGFGTGPGGAGSAGLASIKRLLHDQVGANLAELIYNGVGNDRNNLKNGRPLAYSAATQAQHRNHVHAAVRDQGGLVPSGTVAVNLSGRDERMLSPRQTEAFERWMSGPAMPGYGQTPAGGATGPVQVLVDARVFIGDRDITDIARIEATAVYADAQRQHNINGRSA